VFRRVGDEARGLVEMNSHAILGKNQELPNVSGTSISSSGRPVCDIDILKVGDR